MRPYCFHDPRVGCRGVLLNEIEHDDFKIKITRVRVHLRLFVRFRFGANRTC